MNTNKMKKVSIVIPTYNAEKYVLKCLQSVSAQTYQNLEIIIADDGSCDNTRNIIFQFSQQEKRIRVFINKHRGVSCSRNDALDRCTGDYITFVDADDIVAPDYIETLVTTLETDHAEMAAVAVVKAHEFKKKCFCNGKYLCYEGKKVIENLFDTYEGFLCNKLFIRQLIKKYGIRLNENISICEDLLFNVEYLKHCTKAAYYSGRKYFYRQSSTSSTYRLNNIKWFDTLKVYPLILEQLKNYPSAQKMAMSQYAIFLCEARYRLQYISLDNQEVHSLIYYGWRKIRPEWKTFSLKTRIKIRLFWLCPHIIMQYRRRKLF